MASVLDVAKYILERSGTMSAMKLQKLVYYTQAWSLIWDERPMFHDRIEAWANGPVAPALYAAHRGEYYVEAAKMRGDSAKLDAKAVETVDAVLEYYGKKDASWLSELTHREDPWRDARQGMEPGERGTTEITHEAMASYYESLI